MKSRGFTLVELLVVVTILSVLGMVGLSIFQGTTQNSQDQTRVQQIANFKGALELYRNEFHSYPQTLVELTPTFLESIPTDPRGRSYQYLALPSPGCTSAQRNCLGYVICAKKDGNRGFDLPSACGTLACGGSTGDCDLGLAEGEVGVAAVPIPTSAPPPTSAPIPTPNPLFPRSALISYWKMDEPSGSTISDSNSVNNLRSTSSTNIVTPGKIGNGRTFNGTSELANCTDAACGGSGASGKLDILGNRISISAWIKPNTLSTWASVVNKRPVANNSGYTLEPTKYVPGDRRVQFQLLPMGGVVSTSNLALGSWNHIVATYDGTTARIYLNGNVTADASASFTANLIDNSGDFVIGRNIVSGDYFNGTVDEVGVWNRALTPSEVSNLYNGGLGRQP